MMKTGSNVLYILRLSMTLLLITAVVAAALAGVNHITAPIIAAANEAKTQAAIEAVLPGGGTAVEFDDATGLVAAVYAGEGGYAVQVTPSGFGGKLNMMVGVSAEGEVLGISIISHTETVSLGSVAADSSAAGEAFRQQFVGLSGTVGVDKDGGTVVPITGATITSRAVCEGVQIALECVANLG